MTSDRQWTPPGLVKWITEDFKNRGFPGALRLEAERLVAHALGISRLDIYLQFDKPCTVEEQAAVRELVIRRRKREPLSYIMSSSEFRSLILDVGPGVLIPRPETELLVDAVLDLIRGRKPGDHWRILELGTGSAAIPVALAVEAEEVTIVATEIQLRALKYAAGNIERYREEMEGMQNSILLVQTDCFEGISRQCVFDCIVSNPPYIRSGDIQELQEEVLLWEPGSALDGGADGLEFYRYLRDSAIEMLSVGGFLLCEHGFDQRKEIESLVDGSPLKCYGSVKDYAGHDRILIFQKAETNNNQNSL